MKERLYRNLKRKIITLTLVMSLTPLLILGGTLYYQFENSGKRCFIFASSSREPELEECATGEVAVLRHAWRQKKVTVEAIIAAAKIDRVATVMRPYLESLV